MQLVFVDSVGETGIITEDFTVTYNGLWETEITNYVYMTVDELKNHTTRKTEIRSKVSSSSVLQELSVHLTTDMPIETSEVRKEDEAIATNISDPG